MDKIIELSSDSSNETVVTSQEDKDDDAIDKLIKKYAPEVNLPSISKSSESKSENDVSDGELKDLPVIKRTKKDNVAQAQFDVGLFDFNFDSEQSSGKDEPMKLITVRETEKIQNKNCNKEKKNMSKEIAKLEKQKEKEKKRIEAEQEKIIKEALRTIEKSTKPEECINYITVCIDNSIKPKTFSNAIINSLTNAGYKYKYRDQTVPNTITWIREVQTLENNELVSQYREEKQVLIILDTDEFLRYVEEDLLKAYAQSILSLIGSNQLNICVFGLKTYYNKQKRKKNDQLSKEVQGKASASQSSIEKYQVEAAVTELQLFTSVHFKQVESAEEISLAVQECSKAVAQLPFKIKKQEKYQKESVYFGADNKNCVKVDKNGHGLSRLWNQMLTMLPLVRLETAEAIATAFPSPKQLFEAYARCENEEEKKKLLQELEIRRAAGPLSNVRRVGPELSRKMFNLFCSEENIPL